MKELLKGIFSKKSIFGTKKTIPKFLYKRYHKLLAFTGISFGLGTVCVLMSKQLILVLPFALLTVALLFIAFYFKYAVETRGYTIIKGKVIYVKEMISPNIDITKSSSIRRPSYYHIQTETGEIIRIPANKVSEEIHEGIHVKVYAPLNVFTYDRNGVILLSFMWGYEIDTQAMESSEQSSDQT